jgi:hypothetical protein
MRLIKHVTEQPFIAATAVAALLHSTWALGTLFAGLQPTAALSIEFVGWLAPALLIAFSLDIGLLATSHEIRVGQRSRAKYGTFIVLALSMYYLQWTYMIHHVPALALAAGVSPSWIGISTTLRDLCIWLIPALLPVSTLLYTFSHVEQSASPDTLVKAPLPAVAPLSQIIVSEVEKPVLEAVTAPGEPEQVKRKRPTRPALVKAQPAPESQNGHHSETV